MGHDQQSIPIPVAQANTTTSIYTHLMAGSPVQFGSSEMAKQDSSLVSIASKDAVMAENEGSASLMTHSAESKNQVDRSDRHLSNDQRHDGTTFKDFSHDWTAIENEVRSSDGGALENRDHPSEIEQFFQHFRQSLS